MKKKIIYLVMSICFMSVFTSAGKPCPKNKNIPGQFPATSDEMKETKSLELSPFNYILFAI